MQDRVAFYNKRIGSKKLEIEKLNRNYNSISLLRILTVISAIFFEVFCYTRRDLFFGIVLFVLHIILFLFLVKIHEKIYINKERVKGFIELNKKEIERINGKWKSFDDKGEEYLDLKHPFINDLDIFGKNSLFQWVNNTKTTYGRESLKNLMMFNNLPRREEILERQSSLKELADKIDFRQELTSTLKSDKNKNDETFIGDWVKENDKKHIKFFDLIRIGMPIINVLVIILIIFGIGEWIDILVTLGISYYLLKFIDSDVKKGLIIFEDLKYKIKTYVKAIKIIENEEFKSSELNKLKSIFKDSNSLASEDLLELEKITSWLYDRHNAFYIILNCLFLWDYQMIKKLEKWKYKNKDKFNAYMECLGQFEAMSSLSTLVFNNPLWEVPNITDSVLSGKDLTHPLLGDEAVGNDFYMDKNTRVLLITGSNMSGKSTFLRTVGFNMILSYLGLNVPAKEFNVPIFNIYTCMRTGDDLENNISSFYSEILRVKGIVDGTKRNERIFFLLDEIFKGTNSIDRHEGAVVLINQLLKGDTLGLVSTHDLELCDMEKNNDFVSNYYFKEYYKSNKIMFDYKIRQGVSKTRNAKYLMKMAGIDIE
ncbi:MutS family DNA mismatch repair protein [Sarcina ventriculi]|uniref:DNA mismatch repair protein mutS n=1 Tax=Sarcina ventriculi TaxID=1267 RepID=A0ABP2ATP5_SARVE|nr:MutS family DNA mismatch repair protein [Sarcina ventriculi]CUO03123.1 DNA mismatch repair protein mutS [Sarcina ventriculi]